MPLVDRAVYPEAQYPVGQWDYQLFYRESFDKACAVFEANPRIIEILKERGALVGDKDAGHHPGQARGEAEGGGLTSPTETVTMSPCLMP